MTRPTSPARRAARTTAAALSAGLTLLAGCRAVAPTPAVAVAVDPDPPPGAAMGCGIRGRVVDDFAAPRHFTRVAATTLDRAATVAMHSDAAGRFALTSPCRRVLAIAGRTATGVALGLVWVEDGPVDVELQLPARGHALAVRPADRADAARARVLELVPPAVLRLDDFVPDACDAHTNELRRIRADAADPVARGLAGVALMEAGCSPCPGADASAALIGAMTGDAGLAEAWPFGYGRLFACSPGLHPFEARFAAVVDALGPEFAARVVYGRYVEALAQLDRDGAERMAGLLDGPLADTEFVADLADRGDFVDR